jgi:DNA polymerase-4
LTARTVTVKVKYSDFRIVTRSRTVAHGVTTAQAVMAIAEEILGGVDLGDGVRLLGVSMRNFSDEAEQLQLFGTDDAESLEDTWTPATAAIDDIRRRFGDDSITTASALGASRRGGATYWGPREQPE